MVNIKNNTSFPLVLAKSATGVNGLDEILQGGLPTGRPTLVCGGPGCGKTILAMEFLVHGALELNEPGLFVSFEESSVQLTKNFASFGFDLKKLCEDKHLSISHVDFSGEDIVESGDFNLDALFIRIEYGMAQIGAKRLVLDTMETLFSAINNKERLRLEIARLFHWLRKKGVTTIVTGEKGEHSITRHGFEEYISDCVLIMDHRISEQISKRRLRVLKYRGSAHGTDEHPFIIGASGLSVLPITSIGLDHEAGYERISSGVDDLDTMFEGKGFFKGSSVLISGKAGTGKSSLAAAFAASVCNSGKRCLYLSFEESARQLIRNMQSIHINLQPMVEKELLFIRSSRPTMFGLEEHLVAIFELVSKLSPECIIMDPISSFINQGASGEIKSMLVRMFDHFKNLDITLLATNLTAGSRRADETDTGISSLIDTWITLNRKQVENFQHRELQILKSRGMSHSNETREMILSENGLFLNRLPYLSSDVHLISRPPGNSNE